MFHNRGVVIEEDGSSPICVHIRIHQAEIDPFVAVTS
jgi:hypothetical protein